MTVHVELYGVARSRAGREAVDLPLGAGATLGDALAALATLHPDLVGPVLAAGGRALAPGSVVSLGGGRFTRDAREALPEGTPLLLLPASAGG